VSLKNISKNFIILLFGNIVSQGIIFYSFIKIASILPTNDFGAFAFAQSIANFLTRFTEFGLETIAVRRVTKDHQSNQLFCDLSTIRLFLSLIVISPILLLFIYKNQSIETTIILILSLSMIGISFSTEWYYLAIEKMIVVSTIRIIRACAFSIPLILLLSENPTSIFVSWTFTVSYVSINIIVLYLFTQNNKILFSKISIHNMWFLVKESFPIGMASTLMQIPYYFNTFIIGMVLTKTDVANYSAAYRPILAIWSFGIMALYNAIFPTMNIYVRDARIFSSFIYSLTKIFIICGIILFLFLLPLSDNIMLLLYGGRYLESGYILKMSLFVIAIVLSRTAIEYSLISKQMHKEYISGISIVSALYIILCLAGIIYYEIIGALLGSIISEIIYTGYILHQVKKYNNNMPYIILYVKSMILIILSLIIFFNPFNIPLGIISIVYFVTIVIGLFILKLVSINDIKYLKRILSKA